MKKQVLLFVLLALGIFVSGQNGYSIEAGVFDKTNMTKNIKDSFRGIALTEQQKTFVADNNAFTLHFLKAVNDGDNSGKSFVYSPLSITYVLSMVNAASEGAT